MVFFMSWNVFVVFNEFVVMVNLRLSLGMGGLFVKCGKNV